MATCLEFSGYLYFVLTHRTCEQLSCVWQTLPLINCCLSLWLQLHGYLDPLAARVRAMQMHSSSALIYVHFELESCHLKTWEPCEDNSGDGPEWEELILGLWVMVAMESVPRVPEVSSCEALWGRILDQVLWSFSVWLSLLGNLLLLLSRFSRVWLCATPERAAHQAPPSLGFSRQEYWSGLPLAWQCF